MKKKKRKRARPKAQKIPALRSAPYAKEVIMSLSFEKFFLGTRPVFSRIQGRRLSHVMRYPCLRHGPKATAKSRQYAICECVSQAELGARLGVAQHTLSRLMGGKQTYCTFSTGEFASVLTEIERGAFRFFITGENAEKFAPYDFEVLEDAEDD